MTLSLQPAPTLGAAADVAATLERLGVAPALWTGGDRDVVSPVTGEVVAQVRDADPQAMDGAVARAHEAWLSWRRVPAPRRGAGHVAYGRPAPRRRSWGAQVLLIEAQPVDGVRPVAAPGAPGPGLPGVGLLGNAALSRW